MKLEPLTWVVRVLVQPQDDTYLIFGDDLWILYSSSSLSKTVKLTPFSHAYFKWEDSLLGLEYTIRSGEAPVAITCSISDYRKDMKNLAPEAGPRLNIKTVFPGMGIPMLKIRRPAGRLIFNMGIAIPGKTVFLIETAPRYLRQG